MEIFKEFFSYPQWFIAYRARKSFNIPFDTSGFRIISPPSGRFYADPFVIKHDQDNYIFFEDYRFLKSKGVISFSKIDKDGKHTRPEVVLEKGYHLSYPFLFKWKDQIFMIPETSRNGTIELYQALNFPYDWMLEKVIMKDINACDVTVWVTEKKTWIFTNVVNPGRPQHTDLCLFYADDIFGEWKAHPRNPIVSDIASARPAGKLFIYNGETVRPGQDSALRYGRSLIFNKITQLTEHEYHEEKLAQINPDWYPESMLCHTYNFNEDWEVMDGAIKKKEILRPFRKLVSLFA